ncbi:MAG: BlaI/MecI/CopY family transcriptional regulator [Candidatus Binatia bacterium]
MRQGKKELSPAEWEIMNVIWQETKAVTVRSVVEKAYPKSEKAYTTVQTIMNILTEKGFLARRKKNRLNYYQPTVTRNATLRNSLSRMSKRMFRGSMGTMASFLIDSARLSPEELEELRRILDEKSRGEE